MIHNDKYKLAFFLLAAFLYYHEIIACMTGRDKPADLPCYNFLIYKLYVIARRVFFPTTLAPYASAVSNLLYGTRDCFATSALAGGAREERLAMTRYLWRNNVHSHKI